MVLRPTLLAQFFAVIAYYRWRYLIAFLGIVCANLATILLPLIFKHAVSVVDVTADPDTIFVGRWLGLADPYLTSPYAWGGVMVVTATMAAILRYQMRTRFVTLSRDAENLLREEMYTRLQNQSASFYDKAAAGDLISRLSNDVSVYREVLGPGIIYPAFFMTMTLPAAWVMFALSPLPALVAMIPVVVIPLMMLTIRRVIFRLSRLGQQLLGELSTHTHETYSAMRLIKAYGQEESFFNRFVQIGRSHLRNKIKLALIEDPFYPGLQMVYNFVMVAVVVTFGVMLSKPYSLSVADVVSFMWLQSFIFRPVMMVGWILPLFQRGRGAYSRIYKLYAEPIEVVREGTVHVPQEPHIHVSNVSFHYPGHETPILQDVTIDVPGGALVGITGPPGAGKTTLCRLLIRDYDPTKGIIAINDHPLSHYNLVDRIGYVEQSPHLFSRSIHDNIGGDVPHAAALAKLNSEPFMDGFETVIGERGVTLSGGQKQRVGVARALNSARPLLVLDDIFSALDGVTARLLFETIKGVQATRVLVTHRAELLLEADYIYYMIDGKIVEEGTPKDMVNHQSHFAALL